VELIWVVVVWKSKVRVPESSCGNAEHAHKALHRGLSLSVSLPTSEQRTGNRIPDGLHNPNGSSKLDILGSGTDLERQRCMSEQAKHI
jgi:hypothetical protein